MQPAFADIVWAQSRGSLCSGCEIGDDEGDIVNIINSRSEDEGRKDGRNGAARRGEDHQYRALRWLTRKSQMCLDLWPHFVFLRGIEINARCSGFHIGIAITYREKGPSAPYLP